MKVTVDYRPTMEELAASFCELNGGQQVEFFAKVKAIMDAWPSGHGAMQLRFIREEMTEAAAGFLRDILRPIA